MKYYKLHILTFIFAFVLCAHIPTAHAQEPSVSTEPSPTTYDMVYPGLLPDHPLYFLKVARDNFMSFLKGQPIEKASFALLQADKHMVAANVMLTQKQNTELAHSSLGTAQDYLEEAIKQTENAKKEGLDTQEFCQKLKQASKKHAVMLLSLDIYVEEKDAKKFVEEKKRAEKLSQMAAALHH